MKKKIKLDYFKKFETKSIKQKKKIAFLPKQTLEMQEQWSRVLILSSRKSVVYKFKCQKLKEKRNLDFLVSVCILEFLLVLGTTL